MGARYTTLGEQLSNPLLTGAPHRRQSRNQSLRGYLNQARLFSRHTTPDTYEHHTPPVKLVLLPRNSYFTGQSSRKPHQL